jgi:alkaline phosphatase
MSYELDRDPAKEPSLADMTTKAIDVLSKNSNGYFLMVEGGRIDHALHGTNAKRALEDTIAFDDAIKAVLAKVDLNNTLIVVTADHDHTMAFNGYSHKGNDILGKSTTTAPSRPCWRPTASPTPPWCSATAAARARPCATT